MTRHQRRQHAATAGALTLAAAAVALAWLRLYGEAALAGLLVLSLTDVALRAHREQRRLAARFDWARRRAVGEDPAPLWPCCLLASSSRGRVHSHRCTAPYRRDSDG